MATKRKNLSKKTRFEVFKRDSFTCQYCGRKAPDVVLEVDHIKPVSKGGDNNIINLITSCSSCNNGKSNIPLDVQDELAKNQKQLEELQERRTQMEMMVEWKEHLYSLTEEGAIMILDIFADKTQAKCNGGAKEQIIELINKFGFEEVLDATYIAIQTYYRGTSESVDKAFQKIGGICFTIKQREKDPFIDEKNYIKRTLINRGIAFSEGYFYKIMSESFEVAAPEDTAEMIKAAKECNSWSEFKAVINDLFERCY